AQERLVEWRAIEAVVPSLDTLARLVAEAPGPQVTMDAEQWKVLVAVATGGTVDAVAVALDTGEVGACKAVKGLVDGGLVAVGPADEAESEAGAEPRQVDLDSLVEIPAARRRRAPAKTEPAPEAAVEVEVEMDAEGEDQSPSPTKRLSAAAARKAAEAAADARAEPARAHALARQLASLN